RHAFSPPRIPERLQGDVEPYLVAELEAVGHRFCDTVDLDRNPLHLVFLHHFFQCPSREAQEPNRRVLHPRGPGLWRQRKPPLARQLRRDSMESKGGHKADNSLWHLPGRCREFDLGPWDQGHSNVRNAFWCQAAPGRAMIALRVAPGAPIMYESS